MRSLSCEKLHLSATARYNISATLGINLDESTKTTTSQDESQNMSLSHSIQISKAPTYSSWSRTKEYHLSPPDSPPLYTCKEVLSWSGKFTLDLYNGSTTDGASVANSTSGSLRKNEAVIKIPSTSQSSYDNGEGDGEITSEPLRRHVSLKHETWDFVIAVVSGNTQERYVEKFEWRRSHGDETASLRDGKSTYGWKLVRLHSGGSNGNHVRDDSRTLRESSDGKEVVAVWTDDTQTWFRKAEKGVVAKLEFIGSGAATGDGGFGEKWKLFVAMSALHMRQVNLQYAQAASTASSSNAANAAVAAGTS